MSTKRKSALSEAALVIGNDLGKSGAIVTFDWSILLFISELLAMIAPKILEYCDIEAEDLPSAANELLVSEGLVGMRRRVSLVWMFRRAARTQGVWAEVGGREFVWAVLRATAENKNNIVGKVYAECL